MSKYFQGEFPELEKLLEQHFESVRTKIPQSLKTNIDSLILGGGYGRGEGGVFNSGTSQYTLYNDLDYFLFCKNPNCPSLLGWVHQIEKEETEILGIDVEIKCLRINDIIDPGISMMFYDLVCGHHIVYGLSNSLSAYKNNLTSEKFPLLESTKLLWNRGSGLYFSACRIKLEKDNGYIQRNHQKCKLALGDALLCLHGQYHFSCLERLKRLEQLDDPLLTVDIIDYYNEGIEFKLRPTHKDKSIEDLKEENLKMCRLWGTLFLAVESRRLSHDFKNLTEYTNFGKRIFPDVSILKTILIAVRDRLKYGENLRPVTDYPAGALMRLVTYFNDIDSKKNDLSLPQRYLPSVSNDISDIFELEIIYDKWWFRYS